MTNITSTLRAGNAPSARRLRSGQGSCRLLHRRELSVLALHTNLRRISGRDRGVLCFSSCKSYLISLARGRHLSPGDFGLGCSRSEADPGLMLDFELALLASRGTARDR